MKAKETIKNVLITAGYSEAWIDNIILQLELETKIDHEQEKLNQKIEEVKSNVDKSIDLFNQIGDICKAGESIIIGQHLTEPDEHTNKDC